MNQEDAQDNLVELSRNRWIFNALIGLYVVAPLPLGSNRPWAWGSLAGYTCLLLAAWLFAWMRGSMPLSPALRERPAKVAVGLLVLVVAWIFCQTLPLSPTWVKSLSPHTFELYQVARDAVPAVKESMPLSLDSDATFAAGIRSLFLTAMFLLLVQCLDCRRRLKVFCFAIVVSGFFQAVYGSFTALSGIAYPFVGQGVATGTFVNRNHLAGYLEMALAMGMALLLMGSRHGGMQGGLRGMLKILLSKKALVRLMVIMMVAGLILTRSRMGNTAFFSSLLVTGSLAISISKYFRTRAFFLLLISVILVDILMLGQWFGLENVAERLRQTSMVSEHRDEVDIYVVPLAKDFWLTGAGAATFMHVFPAYAQEDLGVLYDHAHNDYLELYAELGIIGFVPLATFVVLGFCQSLCALQCEHRSHVRAIGFGGCMGIISLSIHSAVDFNLQIPANAMLFMAVIAIVYVAQCAHDNTVRGSEKS